MSCLRTLCQGFVRSLRLAREVAPAVAAGATGGVLIASGTGWELTGSIAGACFVVWLTKRGAYPEALGSRNIPADKQDFGS